MGQSRGGQQARIIVEPAGQFWQQLSARGRKKRAARLASEGKLRWSSPAKSARLTGIYLILAGFSLMFAPNWTFGKQQLLVIVDIFPSSFSENSKGFSVLMIRCCSGLLFDVRTITTGWIQVFGVIAAALGLYCKCLVTLLP